MSYLFYFIGIALPAALAWWIKLQAQKRARLESGRLLISGAILQLEQLLLNAEYRMGDLVHDKIFVFMQDVERGIAMTPPRLRPSEDWSSKEMRSALHNEVSRDTSMADCLERFIVGYSRVVRYGKSPVVSVPLIFLELMHNFRDIIAVYRHTIQGSSIPVYQRLKMFDFECRQVLKESIAARAMLAGGLTPSDFASTQGLDCYQSVH